MAKSVWFGGVVLGRAKLLLLVGVCLSTWLPATSAQAQTEADSSGAGSSRNQGQGPLSGSEIQDSSDQSQAAHTQSNDTKLPDQDLAVPTTTLKGGVRGAALRTVDGLLHLEADAKMLQSNVYEIARECTRRETAVMRGPNYIGNGIVIPALGGPNGTVQVGDLPARRQKLEAWLGSSEEVFNVLQNHMDALILPENAPEALENLWQGMRSTMEAAKGNIETMKELLSQQKFDKKQVGRAALRVYDSMTALEKIRSQALSMVQPRKE